MLNRFSFRSLALVSAFVGFLSPALAAVTPAQEKQAEGLLSSGKASDAAQLLLGFLTLPACAYDLSAAPELAAFGIEHGCKATYRRDIKLGEPKSAQLVLDNDQTDKLVVYRDEVRFQAKPLQPQAVEMFTTVKLLEFPADVSFYQSKARRLYTFIEPGQSLTLLKTPQGSGFYAKRIIDEGKIKREKPVYLIKQVAKGYSYREGSGVNTSPTLDSADCSFYFLL